MRRNGRRSAAAAVALSLFIAGTGSFNAQANVLDDIKNGFSSLGHTVGDFLNDTGIGPVVKSGYDAVTDFIFTYETQPDDTEMENLARSWAVTAWLADEDKKDTNTYYFDNHTMKMVEDLTQIGSGYNQEKTPEGSYLSGKRTGVLKATVADAASYTVEWVNYQDELNLYLAMKMKEKKDAETENQPEPETAAAQEAAAVTAQEPETAAAQETAAATAQEPETAAAQEAVAATAQEPETTG